MTPQDIKTALEAKDGISNVVIGGELSDNRTSITRVSIYYRQDVGSEGVRKGEIKVETHDNGTTYKFLGGKPSILQDPVTPTPQRDLYFTKAEALAWLTAPAQGFTLLDEDDINMRVSGQYDIVTTKIIDADDMIQEVEFMVSLNDQGNGVVRRVKK